MQQTKIEWATHTWNPVVGCSFGCSFGCYAHRFAERGMGEYGKHPKGERFKPRFLPERLDEPLKLKKPSRIFACSMSDLFGPEIDYHHVAEVYSTMWQASWHTFMVLTKRIHRAIEFYERWPEWFGPGMEDGKRLPNVWLGASLTCDDDHHRAWDLLRVPAAVRFISCEPLLGPLDLDRWELLCKTWRKGATLGTYLDWVIVGRQTGPGAVPPKREWVERIVEQCRLANVPLFMKGSLAGIWQDELIQEYPEVSKRR